MKRLRKWFWVAVLAMAVVLCSGRGAVAAEENETFYDRLRPVFAPEGSMPSAGDANILVFLVEFQDERHAAENTVEKMEGMFFGEEGSLTEYYKNASYGKVNITGDVYGWVTLKQNREEYARDGIAAGAILDELFETYDDEIDFSRYDNDKDGFVDGIYLVYAGGTGDWSETWWTYIQTLPECKNADGVQMKKVAFINENVWKETLYHETGHLFGALDYYDTYGGGTGDFYGDSLMHNNKDDLDALSKILIGWVDPQEITEDGTVELSSYSTSPDAAVIYPKGKENGNMFFLVEYVTREKNYDQTKEGLRIYRVNAEPSPVENGFYPVKYRVSHAELKMIEVACEGLKEGDVFDQHTVPSSYLVYEIDDVILWENTGISISGITETEDGIRFQVKYEELEEKEITCETKTWIANNKLFLKLEFNKEMFFAEDETIAYAIAGDTSIPMVVRRDEHSERANKTRFFLYTLDDECAPGTEYTIVVPENVLHDSFGTYNKEISFSVTTVEYPEVMRQGVSEYEGDVSLFSTPVLLENGNYVFFQMDKNGLYMCTSDVSGILEAKFISEIEDYEAKKNLRKLEGFRLENGEYVILLRAAETLSVIDYYGFRVKTDGSIETISDIVYEKAWAIGNKVVMSNGEYQENCSLSVICEDNEVISVEITGHKDYIHYISAIGEGRYCIVGNSNTVTVTDAELNVIGQYTLSDLENVVAVTSYGDMTVFIEVAGGVNACFYNADMELLYKKQLLYTDNAYVYDGFYKLGEGYAVAVCQDKAYYKTDGSGSFRGVLSSPIAEIVFFDENLNRVTSYTMDYEKEALGDRVEGVSVRSVDCYIVTTWWGNYLVEGLTLSAEEETEGITMSETAVTITYGENKTLTVTDLNGNKLTEGVLWRSSDETIVTVSNGVLTVTGNGTAVIFAEYGDLSVTCEVTAGGFPTKLQGIALNNTKLEVDYQSLAAIMQLRVQPKPWDAVDPIENVTWTVSDGSIVMVNPLTKDGALCEVLAVSDGTAIVTAHMGEYTASCEVTIKNWGRQESDWVYVQGQTPSKTVEAGGEEVLAISAYGKGISYQWQYRKYGRYEWTNLTTEGANRASIKVSASEDAIGQYRCLLTDNAGEQYEYDVICFNLVGYEEPGKVEINEANFPDEHFRQYVADMCDTTDPFNGTKDGILTDKEIENIVHIDVISCGISDLRGIEYFYNLQQLWCSYNSLCCFDLSANEKLVSVPCYGNSWSICKTEELLLTEIPQFDVTKASGWVGATYDEKTKSLIDITSDYISYTYDLGRGFSAYFEIYLTEHSDENADNICEVCGKECVPEPSDPIEAFVNRMYQVILEREPDAGSATWVNGLKDGSMTGVRVADGFVLSEEMLNKDISNEEFVKILYRAFFGREADEGGLATWKGLLDNGCKKTYVFAGFANSAEFGALCTEAGIVQGRAAEYLADRQTGLSEQDYKVWCFVERMYTEVLGRTADEAGVRTWVGVLQDGSYTGVKVADGFFTSEEFLAKDMNGEEYVQVLYRAFFNRDADPEGLATWTNALATGWTKQRVFAGFANSNEFGVLCEQAGIVKGTAAEQ